MKLDELFTFNFPIPVKEDESEMVGATENYIITRLNSLKAEGRVTSITTEQLNNELGNMGITSSIITLDPLHLEEFVRTLAGVEDVQPLDDTESGEPNFEIFLKYSYDKDAEEVEQADNKVASDAQNAMDTEKADDKKQASNAASSSKS